MADEFTAFIETLSVEQVALFSALVDAAEIGKPVTTPAQIDQFASAMLTLALRREMLHG